MCGLFGWSWERRPRVPQARREALAVALALENSTRGNHSWGAVMMDAAGRAHVRREVGDIARARGVPSLGLYPAAMVHTRFATTGRVCVANQHPFRAGPVMLAHNGVVWNHDALNRAHGRRCKVDSMHIALHVGEGLPLSDVEGYGAVEWTDDRKPGTVYLSRLVGGSLSVYGVKNHRGRTVGVVWSSDDRHAEHALAMAHLDWFAYEDMPEGVRYSVRAGRLVRFEGRPLALAPWRPRIIYSGEAYGARTCDVDAGLRLVAEPGAWVGSSGRVYGGDDERGLWAGPDGRLHDTEDDDGEEGGGSLEARTADPDVYAMTEAEWLAREGGGK